MGAISSSAQACFSLGSIRHKLDLAHGIGPLGSTPIAHLWTALFCSPSKHLLFLLMENKRPAQGPGCRKQRGAAG